MPKYIVSGEMTISVSVIVEAADPKEAKNLARQASVRTLCASCSNTHEGEWSTSGELDGVPSIIDVQEDD
jgi:hypothetical protein